VALLTQVRSNAEVLRHHLQQLGLKGLIHANEDGRGPAVGTGSSTQSYRLRAVGAGRGPQAAGCGLRATG